MDKSYLHFGNSLDGFMSLTAGFSGVFYIIDSRLAEVNSAVAQFASENAADTFLFEASETTKTMESVQAICSFLISRNADRRAFLVGIGGGITTDVTGFAAAIYKRGIACGYVPSTILAAVDASVGGKTGVNLTVGGESLKNMLGVICQPRFVYYCPQLWKTLPQEVSAEGYAELVKMQVIKSLNAYITELSAEGFSQADAAVIAAARAKLDIVDLDPNERGLRRVLNLGHTYAHAIEAVSHNAISHGNAVSMGLKMAADTSVRLGICKMPSITKAIVKKLQSYGLPTECPYAKEDLIRFIINDKKMDGGKIHFIAIRSLFDVVDVLIDPEDL